MSERKTVQCTIMDSVAQESPAFVHPQFPRTGTNESACTLTVYSKGPHGGTAVVTVKLTTAQRKDLARKLASPNRDALIAVEDALDWCFRQTFTGARNAAGALADYLGKTLTIHDGGQYADYMRFTEPKED